MTDARIKKPRETVPNARGRYGAFGGQYVPETLMNELIRLEASYRKSRQDPAFQRELKDLLAGDSLRPRGRRRAARQGRRTRRAEGPSAAPAALTGIRNPAPLTRRFLLIPVVVVKAQPDMPASSHPSSLYDWDLYSK